MKRYIFITIFSILAGTLALSLLVRSASIQKWVTVELEQASSKILEKTVTIGSVDGVLPFVFSLHDVQLYDEKSGNKIASISHIRAVPNWFTALFGKIALFQLEIDDIVLEMAHLGPSVPPEIQEEALHKLPSITSYLPDKKVSIHSFTCSNITLSFNQNEHYRVQGTLFWTPKSSSLRTTFCLESSSASKLNAHLSLSKKEFHSTIKGTISQIDADKLDLPAKSGEISCEFSSRNKRILEKLWETKIQTEEKEELPFGNGKINLQISVNEELTRLFPDFESLSLASTFELSHNLQLTFELAPIKAFLKSESKPLAITSNIYGKAQNTHGVYSLLLQAQTVGRADFEFGAVELNINCKSLHSVWAATIGLDATITKAEKLPFHFESSLISRFHNKETRLFSFQNAICTLDKTVLHGSFDLLHSPTAPLLVKGALDGHSDDLTPLGKLFQFPVSGKGQASFFFDVTKEQTAKISCSLEEFHTPFLSFTSLNFEIRESGSLSQPKLAATFQVSQGSCNHIEIDSGTINTKLDFSQELLCLPVALVCQGRLDEGPFTLDLAGEFQKQGKGANSHSISLQKLLFLLGEKKAELTMPSHLFISDNEITLSPLHIAWENQGQLQCSALISDDSLSGTFVAQAVPLDFLHFFFPEASLAGELSATGSLQGSKIAPKMHLELKTDSLVIGTQKQGLLFPCDACISCDVDEKSARVDGEIHTKANQTPLHLQLAMPVHFSKEAHFFSFLPDEKIKGSLQGSCEITPFLAPFLEEDELIEGALSFDLSFSGLVSKPEVYGTLSWQKGTLDILKTGAVFSNIMAEGTAYGNSLIVKSISCNDEKNGRLSAQGKIEFKPASHFPYVLHIDAQEIEIVGRDFAQVTATGKAELIGNFQKANLKGAFVAKSAELNLTNDFSQTVPTLDFIYINHPESLKLAQNNNFVLSLDLDVALPHSGVIKGRGLDSTWKGELKISGTTDQTLVHGKIAVDKGTFSFANKEFTLKEGSIDCAGDIFSHSRLNIVASADLGQIGVQLFLRGSLEKPRMQLQSIPALAEREILSWILFNKPITEVSPIQGLQLAQVLLSMNGKASKFNIIDKFKKTFGIDHIDVSRTQADEENPEKDAVAVQVGKYLSKDVFVKLSKDITNAANRVAVEANLHKNVSVEAEVGDDEEGQMSLMWKHEY